MTRLRAAAVLLVVPLLLSSRRAEAPLVAPLEVQRLQGTWLIESVQRDGQPDPVQIGAQMTIQGNRVTFQPNVVQHVEAFS
jgi:hypothetical protein